MQVHLEIAQPSNQKKRIRLIFEHGTVIVGRAGGDTPVSLDLTPFGALDLGVSRIHAALHTEDDNVFVEDMGSSNGTRINGMPMPSSRRYKLRNGDEIEFGQLRATIRFDQK
jgi:pSer/pThr/pTyr-binding forkhead associated (FHA) protein